jgi:hypothetical protein
MKKPLDANVISLSRKRNKLEGKKPGTFRTPTKSEWSDWFKEIAERGLNVIGDEGASVIEKIFALHSNIVRLSGVVESLEKRVSEFEKQPPRPPQGA